jgi:hypothetical protein
MSGCGAKASYGNSPSPKRQQRDTLGLPGKSGSRPPVGQCRYRVYDQQRACMPSAAGRWQSGQPSKCRQRRLVPGC